MTNEISLNASQMLYLDSQVRVTSNSVFNAQEAYENTFEDVMLEENSKAQEQTQKQNKVSFLGLGMPPGFNLDTSFLDELDGADNQQNANQNYSSNSAFKNYFLLEED